MLRRGANVKSEQNGPRLWTCPLWPLGMGFLGLARLKAWCYGRRSAPVRLGRPTVSIGNLTFGGTGKTPFALAMARVLLEMGERPGVLLRGYGRRTRGARRVDQASAPEEVGEEALLLARALPGTPVAVGERREEAAALVRELCSVFILDDAFQHLRVHRDVDLLLVDASRPGDLHAPPVGRLREPLSAAKRASVLVATRGEVHHLAPSLLGWTEGVPRVSARFEWEPAPLGSALFPSWKALGGVPVVAFAGVGHPESFFEQARAAGLSLSARVAFRDHARPTAARLRLILSRARETGAGAVLTTEKDAVKWAPLWPEGLPLVYPRLTTLLEGDVEELRARLAEACRPGASLGRQ